MAWLRTADSAASAADNEALGAACRGASETPLGSWAQAYADLDGHVHQPAGDCPHSGEHYCRACCTHADDLRITEPEPADQPAPSDWRDEDAARAEALCWFAGAFAIAAIVISALTLAGVIPS